MSDLIIKGNIVSDLGAYLPTPYIQSVQVGIDSLTVTCSLYLNFLDKSEQEISDIIADLQYLQVYMFYALGPEYSQRIIDKKVPNIFKEFAVGRTDYEQRQGTFNAGADSGMDIRQGGYDYSTVEIYSTWLNEVTLAQWPDISSYLLPLYARKLEASNFQQIPFSSFTRGTTSFRDEEDNQIIEFSTEFVISVYAERYGSGGAAARAADEGTITTYNLDENSDEYLFSDVGVDDSLTGLTLFAFSSFLDYNSADQAEWTLEDGAYSVGGNTSATNPSSWTYTTVSDNIRRFNAIYPKLPDRLATKQISNIAYENVFKDDAINRELQILYVTSDGANYHDTPIQVGSGTYYTQDGITLKEITIKFQELVDENEDTKDENLKNIIDNISFILETYGESHNLLVKLGDLGRAFTSKTTATPVGRLYQRYKKRLSAVSTATGHGHKLAKKLQKNLKIRDLRDIDPNSVTAGTEYTLPVQNVDYFVVERSSNSDPVRSDCGENPDWNLGPVIWSPGTVAGPRQQTAVDVYKTKIDGNSDTYYRFNLEYGYFFVDQEKAIHYWSNLARLFPMQKIHQWFGKEATSLKFRFDWANVTATVPGVTGGDSRREMAVEVYFDYLSGGPEPSIRNWFPSPAHSTYASQGGGSSLSYLNDATSWAVDDLIPATSGLNTGLNDYMTMENIINWTANEREGTVAAGMTFTGEYLDPGWHDEDMKVYRSTTSAHYAAPTATTTTDLDNTNNYFYSYIMPRNITGLRTEEGLEKSLGMYNYCIADTDYRLMCFEYQFTTDRQFAADNAGSTSVSTTNTGAAAGTGVSAWPNRYNFPAVGFIDETLDIYRELYTKFKAECIDSTSNWQEYLNIANEPCNFNMATGQFNDFFKDGISTHYEGVSPPPWIIVPVIYYMHLDILHDRFGGDKQLVMEAAKTMADQINPTTGNIYAATDFNEAVQLLWETYYDSGGLIDGRFWESQTSGPGGIVSTETWEELGLDDVSTGVGVGRNQEWMQVGENTGLEFGGYKADMLTGLNGSEVLTYGSAAAYWTGFPNGLDAVRVFIWNASYYQTYVEGASGAAASGDEPGLGKELGRKEIT